MKTLRELALELLDDDYGITGDAWAVLYEILEQSEEEYEDIAQAVKNQDGRIYLPENHNIEV